MASAAVASTSRAGATTYRPRWRAACARTSGTVYAQAVDATCPDEATNSTQPRPLTGGASAGGARAIASPNAPADSPRVPYSQARARLTAPAWAALAWAPGVVAMLPVTARASVTAMSC